jgi:hypothetical protein
MTSLISLNEVPHKRMHNKTNKTHQKLSKKVQVTTFKNQVGGHVAMFKIDNLLCKQAVREEIEFYNKIVDDCDFVPFIPQYFGTITLKAEKILQLSQQEQKESLKEWNIHCLKNMEKRVKQLDKEDVEVN